MKKEIVRREAIKFRNSKKAYKETIQFLREKFDYPVTKRTLIRRIKRIQKEKSKRLKIQLKQLDARFEKVYADALLETEFNAKYKKIISLISYLEKQFGGKRQKEWVLRSRCTVD